MAQHAREDQAQAPDLGASVQLEPSESLEGPLDGDPLDAGYVPPDRPYALDEDPAGDTLDDRLQREQGEEPTDPDRSGRITIAGEGAALETPDAMDGVDVGVDGGAAGAEEAAVHEIDDAVIGTAGAPVETEPSVADAPAGRPGPGRRSRKYVIGRPRACRRTSIEACDALGRCAGSGTRWAAGCRSATGCGYCTT